MNVPKILYAFFFIENWEGQQWLEFCAYFMKKTGFAQIINWKGCI
jgi:hypothetical protein